MESSCICPHLKSLVCIFAHFGNLKINQFKLIGLFIVDDVFRFDIAVAHSVFMHLGHGTGNSMNYCSYFRLWELFCSANILSQIMVGAIFTNHLYFFQFLIYKKVVSFNYVFM